MKRRIENRGGKREGAGRPKRPGARRIQLFLDAATIEAMCKLGNGVVGHGVDLAAKIIGSIKTDVLAAYLEAVTPSVPADQSKERRR